LIVSGLKEGASRQYRGICDQPKRNGVRFILWQGLMTRNTITMSNSRLLGFVAPKYGLWASGCP
jgi:hypothetical protein